MVHSDSAQTTGVERRVVEWQVFSVCLTQGHVTAKACGALPGNGLPSVNINPVNVPGQL
jgi:hypothetical protein